MFLTFFIFREFSESMLQTISKEIALKMKTDILDEILKAKQIYILEEQELINSVLKQKEKKIWLKKQLKASSVISRNEKYQHEMTLAKLKVSNQYRFTFQTMS